MLLDSGELTGDALQQVEVAGCVGLFGPLGPETEQAVQTPVVSNHWHEHFDTEQLEVTPHVCPEIRNADTHGESAVLEVVQEFAWQRPGLDFRLAGGVPRNPRAHAFTIML